MTQPEAEITELPSSPGARLKREREARGLTQHQAAEQLNLDPMVVHVLEANDFAALGAPVFVRGHLRRYAAMLGLREDEIVGAYERSKQQVEEPTLVPKARLEMAPVRERTRPRWRWVAGGAFAFLLAAALVAYVSNNGLPWGSSNEKQSAATLEAPPATQAPPRGNGHFGAAGHSGHRRHNAVCRSRGVDAARARRDGAGAGQPAAQVQRRLLGRGLRPLRPGADVRPGQVGHGTHDHRDGAVERHARQCCQRRDLGQRPQPAFAATRRGRGDGALQHRFQRHLALIPGRQR
jgi:hypothetical protein